MGLDAELERLRAHRDKAYKTRSEAKKSLEEARIRRKDAREVLNAAILHRNICKNNLEPIRRQLGKVRRENGKKIKALTSPRSKTIKSQMTHDGITVKTLRKEIADISRQRRDAHEVLKDAEKACRGPKLDHEQAELDYAAAQVVFNQANEAAEVWSSRFAARLEMLPVEAKKRRDERWDLGEKIGVPEQYRHKVAIEKKTEATQVYFGGVDKNGNYDPKGRDHAHYVVTKNGSLSYVRQPGQKHGPQNFIND